MSGSHREFLHRVSALVDGKMFGHINHSDKCGELYRNKNTKQANKHVDEESYIEDFRIREKTYLGTFFFFVWLKILVRGSCRAAFVVSGQTS